MIRNFFHSTEKCIFLKLLLERFFGCKVQSIETERKILRVGAVLWCLEACQIQVPGLIKTCVWNAFNKVSEVILISDSSSNHCNSLKVNRFFLGGEWRYKNVCYDKAVSHAELCHNDGFSTCKHRKILIKLVRCVIFCADTEDSSKMAHMN